MGWHAVGPGRLSSPLSASLSTPFAAGSDDGEGGRGSDEHDDGRSSDDESESDHEHRPVLTHGDYRPGNLLVDERGSITAVLDWGNAHVTHAGYALAHAEAQFVDIHRLPRAERERLRRVFRTAYAEYAPLPADFDRHAPRYKGLWLGQSVANYTRIVRSARGRAQLRRQLENGLERL